MLQPYTCPAEVEFHSQDYLYEYKFSSRPVNTNMFSCGLTTVYSMQLLSYPVKMLTSITKLVDSSSTSQKLSHNVTTVKSASCCTINVITLRCHIYFKNLL
jgi:hypothetical protein